MISSRFPSRHDVVNGIIPLHEREFGLASRLNINSNEERFS